MPQVKTITETELIQGYDIVILSASEWKDNAVSNMQIAALLSETNRVVYIETIGGRMPRLSELGRVWQRLKRIIHGASTGQTQRGLDPRRVTIFSPFAIPIHGNTICDWLNRQMLAFQVRRLQRRLGIKRPIVWSFSPRWQPVIDVLKGRCLIFHCVDALHTYDASPAFRSQFEQAVRNADIVFTPGLLLERELQRFNTATYRIGHGCGKVHLEHDDDGKTPADLGGIPEPRVVYAGTLANWVDYPLFRQVAQRLPKVSFVLIGYVHALALKEQVESLLSLPNVHHLGYKNFSELPSYYRRSAVGIVPYQAANEHIHYSTPTKFLDYLTAGLPTISTRFPAAEALTDIVHCAATAKEFADAIERMLINNSPEKVEQRRAFARLHTWERQVSKMCWHIRGYLEESQRVA